MNFSASVTSEHWTLITVEGLRDFENERISVKRKGVKTCFALECLDV